jgi:DNA-binding NarL/FixJ family response regulator
MRVLLVDDHELFLEAAKAALEVETPGSETVFEVVGTATEGRSVLSLVNRLRPDVVVLDIGLPGLDGLGVLQLLRETHPRTKVVMLSATGDTEYIRAAFARGASAYILKTISAYDLVSALRQVVSETVYVALEGMEPSVAPEGGLSEREVEILGYAARGLPNAEIAKQLCVTEQTVKFHLTHVYRKLAVNNRTEAAREARRLGLVVHRVDDFSVSAAH